MKKRIGSLLLILALCFTLLPTAALAEDDAWNGSTAAAFAGGTGTAEDPYQIANGAELAYLASSVNSGETYTGKKFVLTVNIDLNGLPWTPIANSFSDALFGGTDYRIFAGNFDGKGYTISNVSIGSETTPFESDVFGLFGATGGKISNLNLYTVSIHGVAKLVQDLRLQCVILRSEVREIFWESRKVAIWQQLDMTCIARCLMRLSVS